VLSVCPNSRCTQTQTQTQTKRVRSDAIPPRGGYYGRYVVVVSVSAYTSRTDRQHKQVCMTLCMYTSFNFVENRRRMLSREHGAWRIVDPPRQSVSSR
jgi:hypothetical protein